MTTETLEPRRPDRRASVKQDDGFVATFLSAPLANWLLARLEGIPITPNQVTALSLVATLLAALCFSIGLWPALAAGALLLQLAFVLDCLDGQLARHTGRSSRFGAWLDLVTDRLGDVVVLAGIAFGCAARSGSRTPFFWSYLAVLVIFYRHFDALILPSLLPEHRGVPDWALRPRGDEEKVRMVAVARRRGADGWGWFLRALNRLAPKGTQEPSPVVFWIKRALLLDGGERYLLVSILALVDRPEWIFPCLVVWGGIVYPLITVRRWAVFGGGEN